MKQENQRLKSIALTNQQIENMLQENKNMKLQLQMLQGGQPSDAVSALNFDT